MRQRVMCVMGRGIGTFTQPLSLRTDVLQRLGRDETVRERSGRLTSSDRNGSHPERPGRRETTGVVRQRGARLTDLSTKSAKCNLGTASFLQRREEPFRLLEPRYASTVLVNHDTETKTELAHTR